jgi:environmental stress-induced protein Ves
VSHRRGSIEWLAAAHRQDVPWKNGGGITREVVASPAAAGLERFDWRISTAEVRTPGPFSAFPGIDRTLCVLAGRLSLSLGGRPAIVLGADSAPFEFAGDMPAQGAPVDGPVLDLNVMARRGSFGTRVRRLRAGAVPEITAPITVLFALGALTVAAGRRAWALNRWDALRFAAPLECSLESPQGAAAYLIEISPITTPG